MVSSLSLLSISSASRSSLGFSCSFSSSSSSSRSYWSESIYSSLMSAKVWLIESCSVLASSSSCKSSSRSVARLDFFPSASTVVPSLSFLEALLATYSDSNTIRLCSPSSIAIKTCSRCSFRFYKPTENFSTFFLCLSSFDAASLSLSFINFLIWSLSYRILSDF